MKIRGFRRVNGVWCRFEDKVGIKEYVRHIFMGLNAYISYQWSKFEDWRAT
jgi:hypothetical protein